MGYTNYDGTITETEQERNARVRREAGLPPEEGMGESTMTVTGSGEIPISTATTSATNPAANASALEAMIARDQVHWLNRLIAYAKPLNFGNPEAAAQEELAGALNDIRNPANANTNPGVWLARAESRLAARGKRGPDAGGGPAGPGGPASGSGFPTPIRTTIPAPERFSTYTSNFKATPLEIGPGVGEAQRNSILTSILNRPETLDQTAQDQLFEEQKELAQAQVEQQRARLQQAVLQGGLSDVGGRATAGQAAIEEGFTSELLKARRDVATKAIATNRQDKLAALTMQQAIAAGDTQKALDIYKANMATKAQEETFLREAADLNSRNLNEFNRAALNSAVAQSGENMDFFKFLELQRQFEAQLAQNYFVSTLPRI